MEGLLSKETVALLRYVHGGLNLLVAIMVWSMLALGLGIRRRRASGRATLKLSSPHMAIGPVLAVLGPMGFLAGVTLITLDKGSPLEYPPHFVLGFLIALALPGMFLLSRALLKGSQRARRAHRRLGITLAVLYMFQVLLGIGILM